MSLVLILQVFDSVPHEAIQPWHLIVHDPGKILRKYVRFWLFNLQLYKIGLLNSLRYEQDELSYATSHEEACYNDYAQLVE